MVDTSTPLDLISNQSLQSLKMDVDFHLTDSANSFILINLELGIWVFNYAYLLSMFFHRHPRFKSKKSLLPIPPP